MVLKVMKDLILYDRMITSIALCQKTDQVKNIRDKALALEHYARQATNVDAERQAINVRVRAERRAGELLRGLQKSPGGKPTQKSYSSQGKKSKFAEQKQASNISDSQAANWQQLAEMPEEKFTEKIEDMKRKVGTRRKPRGPKVKPIPDRALWVWGQIKDFEKGGIFNINPNIIFSEMLDTMKPDIRRVVPQLIKWLRRFKI